MPIHTTPVEFSIRDPPTLLFMEHCLEHWKDVDVCTDAHVAFMKHLVRILFRLPHAMDLVGIRFDDGTLSMLSPPVYHTFYTITNKEGWTAALVRIEGFDPHWGMDMGFWEGLTMANSVLIGEENAGPLEVES